jgi:hypothetical protein
MKTAASGILPEYIICYNRTTIAQVSASGIKTGVISIENIIYYPRISFQDMNAAAAIIGIIITNDIIGNYRIGIRRAINSAAAGRPFADYAVMSN